MARRRHTPERINRKLAEGRDLLAGGIDLEGVCHQLGIAESTWARWLYQYGVMKTADGRHLDLARPTRVPVLGIDVGGVLVDRVAEGSDTSFFGDRPMETPAVEGALEAVADLVELFEYRVHIVSKAGPKIAEFTRRWLGSRGATGDGAIPLGNVHFVRKRPEKHPICEQLGVTHFIDDRLDVLAHLATVDRRYLFIGGLGDHVAPSQVPDWATTVDAWPGLVGLLRRDVERRSSDAS
jgi:hypothetical protein